MRAFVAIDPDDAARQALAALQRDLPAGRPVPEDNLHLTLAFLDNRTEAELEALHDGLESLRHAPFTVQISGVSAFGGARPAVVFAAVNPAPQLSALQGGVLRVARAAGIDLPRRRFRPHVTLARLASGPDARLAAWMGAQSGLSIRMEVGCFTLYQSQLRPDGARHTPLAAYPLILEQ